MDNRFTQMRDLAPCIPVIFSSFLSPVLLMKNHTFSSFFPVSKLLTAFKNRTRDLGFLVTLIFFIGITQSAKAQVDVSGTITGITPVTYTTLKAACDAINAGTHTGVITINVTANTTEAAIVGAPSVGLIASGSGAASYTAINMQPVGGAWTISGAATAGQPLLELNGADNLTIDGLNSGGNALTIENTTVSSTSGTSTIRFIGGATNNTLNRCSLKGAGTMSVATNGATVFFSTDGVSGNGNDNNTISNCDIGPSGSNLPSKGILGNGSTTSQTIGNSGIVITNNDIHDFFGAAVTSAGIATNGGCNTWTITDNRFFQGASRTWTTGALHCPINIGPSTATSGAQGFTITGNIIGYASNIQTGTYSLTGSTGKFIGIQYTGITLGAVSNINSNTIASVSMTGVTSNGTSTNSPFIGIFINSGLTNTNSNILGSQSTTGSLTFSTTTTSSTDVMAIYNFSSDVWTANSNNIGGISVTNAGASGTFVIYGIRANTGTTVFFAATSNNVGGTIANSIQLTATGVSSQVIGIHTVNAPAIWTSNMVRNLTTNIGTGTTTGASVIGMNITTSTPNHTLSQNTIFNLTNTNTTAASIVTGIQFTGSSANLVESNLIYGLVVASNSTSSEVNGIRVGGGTTTYRNNMIAIGAGITNAIGTGSTTGGINGINEPSGTDNFFHNSIYIGDAPTAGVGPSYAFNSSVTTNTRSFRDNIFFNARSNAGATGKNYAVRVGGTAPNPSGLTINNNLYYLTGSGAVFGYFNSLDVANLGAWKSVVGQDLSSFEALNPQFIAPASSTPDLHINPSVITVIEGNGADVGVTNDYDGQIRSGLTPVDIGADAGNFMGVDLSAPVISYSALGAGCTPFTNQVLTTTITDASGVPTVGIGLPVVYWKVNAGPYTGTQGIFGGGNTYTFTFGNTANTGDVVSYYIVAQDLAPTPNVGSNPSPGASGFSANPPAASTPPTTPNVYTVTGILSGSYTVGVGGNYSTITEAVADYNSKCLGGAVVFNLIDASYIGETFPITINANSAASAVNTLTIKTTLAGTSISGSNANALFILNGADYVTIDGSISNTPNTVCPVSVASRDLTITNTNTGTSSAVIWFQTATADGATNNAVMNCNLIGNSNTTTLFGIGSGSSTISATSLGTGNNNNSFINNNISKTQYGIYSQGASAANKNTGTIIIQNLINTVSPNNVAKGGIWTGFENNITISGNRIENLLSTSDLFAISLGVGNSFINSTTGLNEVTNATVTKNIINSIVNNGTNSAAGISLAAATSGTTLIANNMIGGVSANGTSSDFAAGIMLGGGTGSVTNVYYNTSVMNGTIQGAATGSTQSFALAVTNTTAPTLDFRNNILLNTQLPNASGTTKFYAIGLAYSSTPGNYTGLTSNNNDLFATSGANYFLGITGGLSAGTVRTLLSNWQTETGRDGSSLNILPVFVSSSDLHIVASDPANLPLDNGAVSIAGVTDDIDCDVRMTDIGADEFAPLSCTGAMGGTAVGNATFCGSGTPSITASGYSAGTGSVYQWQSSSDAGFSTPVTIIGQTNPATLSAGVVSTTTYFRLKVKCTIASDSMYSNSVLITINPSTATISGPSSKCSNDPAISLMESGGTGTSWSWSTTETTQSISVNPGSTTIYTVTVTSGGGCTAVATQTVTVNPNPTGVTAMASANPVCSAEPFNLSSTVDPSVLTYSQNFDGVTAPALPAGWVTSATGEPILWVTSTSSFVSSPNAGFSTDPASVSDKRLDYATYIYSATAQLTFKNNYSLESTFDGGVLEISINGGPFTDIITAGGSFVAGGYNGVISSSFSNPIAGRNAWTGTAGSFITTTINLPASAAANSVVLRWRLGSDTSTSGAGWYIDDVVITDVAPAPTFSWSSSPMGFSSSLQNPTGVTEIVSTNYTVTVTNSYGCSNSASTGVIGVNSIVTNINDAGTGSLRDLIACAGDGGVITFDPSIWNQTINLVTPIDINKNITISGPPAMGPDVINISSNGNPPPVFNNTPGGWNLQFSGNLNLKP